MPCIPSVAVMSDSVVWDHSIAPFCERTSGCLWLTALVGCGRMALLKKSYKKGNVLISNQAAGEQELRQAGYRLTKPRLAVLHVLQDSQEGLNPEEVYQRGQEICDSLSLVTVYRTLELLDELGVARRVHSEAHCHRYASAEQGRHYVICQGCHRVVEFPCAGLEGLIAGVRKRTGFQITDHLLELSGFCPDCQDRRKVSRPGAAGEGE